MTESRIACLSSRLLVVWRTSQFMRSLRAYNTAWKVRGERRRTICYQILNLIYRQCGRVGDSVVIQFQEITVINTFVRMHVRGRSDNYLVYKQKKNENFGKMIKSQRSLFSA